MMRLTPTSRNNNDCEQEEAGILFCCQQIQLKILDLTTGGLVESPHDEVQQKQQAITKMKKRKKRCIILSLFANEINSAWY
jgi:hypothetical protein